MKSRSAVTDLVTGPELRDEICYLCSQGERNGRGACSVRTGTIEDFVVKHIRTIAADPVMLTRVAEILQQQHAERAPALEKELAQLAAE